MFCMCVPHCCMLCERFPNFDFISVTGHIRLSDVDYLVRPTNDNTWWSVVILSASRWSPSYHHLFVPRHWRLIFGRRAFCVDQWRRKGVCCPEQKFLLLPRQSDQFCNQYIFSGLRAWCVNQPLSVPFSLLFPVTVLFSPLPLRSLRSKPF